MGRYPDKYHIWYYRWFFFCWIPFMMRESFDDLQKARKAVWEKGFIPYQIYNQHGQVVCKRDKKECEPKVK